ncbi:MAG TPA: porin [Pseudomonadales bacterium]|nr:porin [Pseudomonadales bacterium]
MINNRKFTRSVLAVLCSASAMSYAAEPGPYVEGTMGQSTMKASTRFGDGGGEVDTFHMTKDETAYKAAIGYNLTPWLGLEGGYVDFGSPSDHANLPTFGRVDGKVDATGWEEFVVGSLPVGPIELFAKVGAVESDIRFKAHSEALDARRSEDESNTELAYGGGAAYELGKLALRAEVETYDANKLDDMHLITAGLTYHI